MIENSSHTENIFDVGEVTVAVPQGWKAFNNVDIHASEIGTIRKCSVNVCKGATVESDILRMPYLKLDYRGKGIYLAPPMKRFYDNVSDIPTFVLGEHTWQGFSCQSMGYPLVILYADEGDDQFLVTVCCGGGDVKISIEDTDVQKIISSFTVKSLDAE